MENERVEPNEQTIKKGSSELAMFGLLLAFAPSLFILCLKDVSIFSEGHGSTFWLACGISFACCFVSSALLFRHKTAWAILLGILFFFLNIFISLMLGC